MAETMVAAVWRGTGPQLELTEIPVPEPKTGEALVRVTSCGVCHTDYHVLKGEVAFPSPAVLGHEISATVVRLGPDTDAPALAEATKVVGAFVMPCGRCVQCERGRDDMCINFFAQNRLNGTLYDGSSRLRDVDGSSIAMYSMAGMAEYAVVPVTALSPLPDSVPEVPAAILGCAMFTAYGALRHSADLQPGDTVAVVAIGGVGQSIVQLAKAMGAGRVIAVGIAAGAATAQVEITPLVRRGYHLMGSFGARTRVDLPAVVDLAASGRVTVQDAVSREYTLDQVNDAFAALGRGEIRGRAVVKIS